MSLVPPPQLPDRPCPNCGQIIPAGLQYCSLCGHGAKYSPARPAAGSNIGLVIAFVLVGIPSAVCGGCFMIVGGGGLEGLLPGLFGLTIFGALLWALIKSRRTP